MMDSKIEKMVEMFSFDKIIHLVITVLPTQTTGLLLGNVPYFHIQISKTTMSCLYSYIVFNIDMIGFDIILWLTKQLDL